MRDSFSKSRETHLLVDDGAGVVLEAPGLASVSRRYVESHPFIESVVIRDPDREERIYAGSDAKVAAAGRANCSDYVEYVVEREVAGFLEIRRVA